MRGVRRIAMRVRMVPLLALSFALQCLPAPASAADDVDRYVLTQLERQHLPALSLAIVRGDRVVKIGGYGFANLEYRVPATADTVYEIGSVTKQFTSMAVMLLREQGRLSLDDPLGKYLTNVPEAWKPVTLKQLLSHTSGIPDYEEVMGYDSYRLAMTPEQVFAYVSAKPLDFPSGTQWRYSNTGYFLLTLVIEKVSGEKYVDFVTRNILVPAGMTHTRSSEPADIIPRRAAGYDHLHALRNRDAMQPSATGGAGMLVSTVGDMIRWAAVIGKKGILKPESYALTFTDTLLADGSRSGYGFGWFVSPMRDHRALEHTGGTAGFSCDFLYLPDDDVTIIVLTNSGTANPQSISNHFARQLVPGLRYTTIPDRHPEVGRLLLDFYSRRPSAEPYLSTLTPEFAKVVAPYWLANLDYYKAIGAPLGVELVEQIPDEQALRYRVRYKDVARLVRVKLDASGKISELSGAEE
jgi:CubicO group peptidase (beta-lactamase class C family)